MHTITLVTGNAHKLEEWRRVAGGVLQLEAASVDQDEIQSLSLEAVVTDKVKRAYDALQRPVIVEDVSAVLDGMNGLPGPFIKFFHEAMGNRALYTLADVGGDRATIQAMAAYYDGRQLVIGTGTVHGTIVSPRGSNGFGFDGVFMLDGKSKTYAELSPEEKAACSHRSLAIRDLAAKLQSLLS